MAKIRRCVKKKVILSPVFDADVDIRLSDKPVLRVVQIVNTAFQKRAISVMRDNGSVVVILYYSVGDKINLVINRIKKIRYGFDRVRPEPVVGIKEENIFAVRPRKCVISRLGKAFVFL